MPPQSRRRPRKTDPEAAQRRLARIAEREAARPTALNYPAQLPVVERKDDLLEAIAGNQVVIIAGETGSGKTTQIPKMCLDLGRGVAGTIGHTQPRRIAARSVAERISEELGVELGTTVGYQVRFTDKSRHDTLIKVMTDGILLSEMQRDRDLRRYDTIIVDEAHERSLNIDFLLGYLKQLLPRRPDLKVIVTSATIDVNRFAQHFADAAGKPAPIIEVSGRTFDVEVLYRPLLREGLPKGKGVDAEVSEVEIDQVTGVCEAVEELWTSPSSSGTGPQDILVFCSGEREIRDATEALSGMKLPSTQVLPLYGRLSAAEQHRIFSRSSGRRIVVATNVAETSLTVPGIRYVIDTGTARISRYSQRLKVQRLPIEPISQASANQRSGRCGRLAPGTAIRLYSEEDFEARPTFTDPEILRTNLASVILGMTNLGLGAIEKFGFIEPPDSRQIADGLRLLEELQAINPQAPASQPRKRLTSYGRALVALPVDPRLARMLVEAERNGALREVQIIVAALSMQDPRERPADKQAQADQQHARFKDDESDFMSLLNLWNYLKAQQKDLSGSAFRRMCQREFLHYLRVREWQDLHTQIKQAAKSLGLQVNSTPASPQAIHQSLLAGLLSHVGLYDRDKREYHGARNAKFHLQPGSTLFKKNPDWVMTAELVETSRLWARTNAAIDPEWVEGIAGHLVKRSHAEPRWSRSRASAIADERVTLYGVPLVAGRPVPYGRIDPEVARDLFIRHGLVEGDWDTRHDFFHANRRLLRQLGELEARARRRDIIVDDETLIDFYDERLPADVVSGAHFDAWWKKARRDDAELLTFTEDLLLSDTADDVSHADYPGSWKQGQISLPLTYQFEPGSDADGVTVHVPIEVLNQVEPVGFDWLVPGLRQDLIIAMVRALPKNARRHFVPAPDHARAAMAALEPSTEPVTAALAAYLSQRGAVPVRATDFEWERVPDHLKVTFRVERRQPAQGRKGRGRSRVEILGEGKDLEALQGELAPTVRSTLSAAASGIERTGLTSWDFDRLPETFEQSSHGRSVHGYPALVDRGDRVDIKVWDTKSQAHRSTVIGIRRLLLLNTTPPWKRVLAILSNEQKLALGHNPHGSVPALLDDALAAAVDSVVEQMPGAMVRSREDFDRALALVKQQSVPRIIEILEQTVPILDAARRVHLGLRTLTSPRAAHMSTDMQRQIAELIKPGFIAEVGYRRMPRMVVYLKAMLERLDKGVQDLDRDVERTEQVQVVLEEYASFLASLPAHRRLDADVRDIWWQIQELRVSLFAQRLGTAGPVSPKRIYTAMDAAEA
ncbi:ATP-dependent RNA helicase HrpA [Ornithinimicrobium sp. Arc0846-15]|nr:ATP-dependent RNA helicase HrpA [Ornithinimicrobium laminariae]